MGWRTVAIAGVAILAVTGCGTSHQKTRVYKVHDNGMPIICEGNGPQACAHERAKLAAKEKALERRGCPGSDVLVIHGIAEGTCMTKSELLKLPINVTYG